jgi:hypothetical protein
LVEFQPEANGSPSVGYTDEDGQYTLQFSEHRWGAMVGRHIVRLDFDYTPWGDDPPPPFRIPERYNSNTELHVEVTRGSNSHDFDIRLDPMNANTAVNWR